MGGGERDRLGLVRSKLGTAYLDREKEGGGGVRERKKKFRSGEPKA